MSEQERLFEELALAVLEMEEEKTISLSKEALEEGIDPVDIIEKGLSEGMTRAGELFEEEEYFVPELLMCADAMNAGIDFIRPHIKIDANTVRKKAIIGVIEGDTHDIGKNLVKLMMDNAGFEMIDLGRDIPAQQFVDRAKEVEADLICISSLMTTTMDNMAEVIQRLETEGIRGKFKVMVGGGPISGAFAKDIGADGYSANAAEAVRLARTLAGVS
ncbi:cobalamin-binding protein [Anoxybacterium hadale]|uniref:Cobalamin-binding protein n=1 Tax=Anoxybacterium hadale TaxID=3408580 RepID=A0ACD1A7F7_9FIRM|nr:cobalamin-binding protein [Clostridiales bacterium]